MIGDYLIDAKDFCNCDHARALRNVVYDALEAFEAGNADKAKKILDCGLRSHNSAQMAYAEMDVCCE